MKKSARFSIRNILASFVIVAFGLGMGYIMFQSYVPVELRQGNVLGASTFSMPKIGTDTLADPEYYTPALAGIGSEDEIKLQDVIGLPSRVETPPGPIYGFGLKADTKEDLSEISFIVHKQDGNVVGPYLIEVAEDLVDRDGEPISGAFTDPYLFAAGVAKIDFFNTDNKEFTIKYIEFIGQGDEDQVNTQTVVSDANRLYKERFMQEAGLNIVTRDEYGAADDNIFAPGWTPPYYAVNRIVVHHTATGVDMGNPANTVAAIWRYHTYDLDWGDVGYNFLIDPYGNIYEGRAGINGVRGNHAPPNEGSIGISLLGDFTSQLPTQAALDSLVRLTAYLAKVNQINLVYKTSFDSANPEGMYGHRAINATACPGNSFFPLLPQVRDAAASLMAQQGEIDVKINQVNTMVDGREYYQTDTATQILIKLDGLPDLLKEKLKNPPPRFALKIEQDDALIYEIPKDMLKQSLTELKVVAPEAVSQPNYKYELQAWVEDAGNERSVPTDYNATEHWYLEQIQAPEAWYYLFNNTDPQSHTGSSSVRVAVIDTGVAYEDYNFSAGSVYDRQYYKSPDLDNATFTDPYDAAFDYLCQYRSLTADPCTAGEWAKVDHANDDQGHGTFVSSVIGATISDAAPNILLGIAPSVKIIPIKVSLPVDSALGLDSGAIYTNFLEMGIDHARLSGANVINISLGAESSEDPYLLDAINDAYNAGITIVASSGNHTLPGDAEYVLFPANLDNVIAVGASNYAGDARATYSNYGPELDVVAPVGSGTGDGGVIATTLSCFTSDCTEASDLSQFPANGSYIRGRGTSFAAPQVAAQAALLKSFIGSLSPFQIKNLLTSNSNDISPAGFDNNTGFGSIRIKNTIEDLNSNPPLEPKSSFTATNFLSTKYWDALKSPQYVKGDFNNDGLDDVATMYNYGYSNGLYTSMGIWVFENDGSNHFAAKNYISTPYWDASKSPQLVSGDFNNDGIDDIATMYNYGYSNGLYTSMAIWVFENSGSRTFTAKNYISTPYWDASKSPQLVSGDFNSDNVIDIATMYNYGYSNGLYTSMGIWVFENSGSRTFTARNYISTPYWDASKSPQLVSGDFNADNVIDIATMYNYGYSNGLYTSMGIWAFINSGAHSLTARNYISTKYWDASKSPQLVSGDFNNDGLNDVATMYNYGYSNGLYTSMGIWVFTNSGSTFSAQNFLSTRYWDASKSPQLVSGDFNNDGSSDVSTMYDYGYSNGLYTSMGLWVFN